LAHFRHSFDALNEFKRVSAKVIVRGTIKELRSYGLIDGP